MTADIASRRYALNLVSFGVRITFTNRILVMTAEVIELTNTLCVEIRTRVSGCF